MHGAGADLLTEYFRRLRKVHPAGPGGACIRAGRGGSGVEATLGATLGATLVGATVPIPAYQAG